MGESEPLGVADPVQQCLHFGDALGFGGGEVLGFAGVGLKVVELRFGGVAGFDSDLLVHCRSATGFDEFPASLAERQ